jgi:hypothetical protein
MRIACCADSASPGFRAVVRSIARRSPDVVLFAGDARAGGFGISRLRAARWRRAWGSLAPRVLTVPGNHDYERDGREPWRWLGGWTEDVRLSRGASGAFVLDLPFAEVFGFDSGPHARRVPREQLEWAASRVGGAPTRPHRIALFHAPAFPVSTHIRSSLDADPTQRDLLWDDLEGLGITLVLNGHEHVYARREIVRRTRITQIITGGAGAPLSPLISADVLAGSSEHHAVLLESSAEGLRGSAFTPDDETIDAFTMAPDVAHPAIHHE